MKFSLTLLLIILSFPVSGQDMKKKSLTKANIEAGVKWCFTEVTSDGFSGSMLLLFKNGRYSFSMGACLMSLSSKGTWYLSGKVLVLHSDIQKDDVPVSLSVSHLNRYKFGDVKNIKGESAPVLININADSVSCLPGSSECGGTYHSIDSVRIRFDNGITSRWLKVAGVDGKCITITVETDIDITAYKVFNNFRFRWTEAKIIPMQPMYDN